MISKKITAAFIAAAAALAPLFTCGQTALAIDAADSSAAVSDSAAPASDIMRFTVYDSDTGELIPDEILDKHPFWFCLDVHFYNEQEDICTGPMVTITKNPTVDTNGLADLYKNADVFNFCTEFQPDVTVNNDGSVDVELKARIQPTGDANGDGRVTMADAVTLQQWLLGKVNDTYFDWAEADLCVDNVLDVYDLVLLRKKLVSKDVNITDISDTPVPVLAVDYSLNKLGKKSGQDLLVFDQTGAAYRMYTDGGTTTYGENGSAHTAPAVPLVNFREGTDWYNELKALMAHSYSGFGEMQMDSDTLAKTNDLLKRADELKNADWLSSQIHWFDGNEMSIYLIKPDENGNARFIELCSLIGYDQCRNDPEIIEYVGELLRKNYVNYEGLYDNFDMYIQNATIVS